MILATYTEVTQRALDQVRDPSHMAWYIVFFVGVVMYVYANEVERGRFDIIAAGLAFFLFDIFNELVNSAWLHISGTSALWTVTGPTVYQPLIGWTVEIACLFLISGIEFVKWLPKNRALKVLGIPNRVFYVLLFSCICVFVEVLLHAGGIFHWHWSYWGVDNPLGLIPIVLLGYATFFAAAAFVFDLPTSRRRFTVIGAMAAIDVVLAVTFGLAGWL